MSRELSGISRSSAAIGGVGVLLLFVLLTAVVPSSAQSAISGRTFNAELSLTGTCETDPGDEVVDPWCPGPPGPSMGFEAPSIDIDSFGDMYVSSSDQGGSTGGIDVFSPTGEFLTEVPLPGARSLAVDGEGNLYVVVRKDTGVKEVLLFRPEVYDPVGGEIAYGAFEVVIEEGENNPIPESCVGFGNGLDTDVSVAVNPVNGHLYVRPGECVSEFGSAAEGNPPLDLTIGGGTEGPGTGIISNWSKNLAVDVAHDRLYVTDSKESLGDSTIAVFELSAPHNFLGMLNGSDTPAGAFRANVGTITLAVDEETGHLFVSDLSGSGNVYEMGLGLDAAEEYLGTLENHGFKAVPLGEIAYDNSAVSPNHGTLYVPSAGASALDHTYAFVPVEVGSPEVGSPIASGVSENEAFLSATVDPNGEETQYRIEYTTHQNFDEGAVVAREGSLAAGSQPVQVTVSLSGLAAGTSYRFRVVAENSFGSDQAEASFRTYPATPLDDVCPNEVFRVGLSASLPDCRAYELVTPPTTNGRSPLGAAEIGPRFPTLQASPDGGKVTFRIEGGVIPGEEGSGSFNGDSYLARRSSTGWSSGIAGPSGADAIAPLPGSFSPDQEHSFWQADVPGESPPDFNAFIRYPDGHSEPVGRGSLGVDPYAEARLISEGGSHVIFVTRNAIHSALRLEPNAPPAGTTAVYDRTADEVTHVVSLLPGDITPEAGQNAVYVGASLDGAGIAFSIEETLYLRKDNQVTYEVGEGVTYAGIAEGGRRIFYLKAGNLFALDTASGLRIQFSKGGETTPVNVSSDGSTAYFISPDVLILTGKKENPSGAVAQQGAENLYLSRDGQIVFVGTVEPLDVKEGFNSNGGFLGLGMWVEAVRERLQAAQPAIETSRLTPDGNVLLFQSRAALTGYDPEGHTEIYRYDAQAPTLTCLSCNPTGAPATGKASLQTVPSLVLGLSTRTLNIRPGGDRAFFQSDEALVPDDVDDRQDVYEWEAQGVGSCTLPAGCVYLISSGQSERDDHLFAVSESGDDVFFLSGDILLNSDREATSSIYDARVGGGFSEEETSSCQGEGCRAPLSSPPALPAPATPALGKSGNVHQAKRCPKGKRKVVRKGKARCVKKHRRHHKRTQRSSSGRVGR